MPKVNDQIPLTFNTHSKKTFQTFVVGNNHELLDSLQSFYNSSESIFYIWGEIGAGKTHVLQAYTDSLHDLKKSAVIINPVDINHRENVSLIEMFDVVCIDKVEDIVANQKLEEALFFWINEIRQANKKIILASQISNQSQKWQLPDLKSRLLSGRTHEITVLNRHQALKVFAQQADQRGIVIDVKTLNYLQNNCSMDMKFLSQLLNQLDEITLIQKKPVTIPLLKKIL
jgi:DnaA family protein